MNFTTDTSKLKFSGEHLVDMSAEELWITLNDPDVLQQCIKGCSEVTLIDQGRFCASFRLRVGPIKKTFKANMQVIDSNPPKQYRLVTDMNAGIAGAVNGTADVYLEEIGIEQTNLHYSAQINAKGWIGELGIKILGGAAVRYMERFFETLIQISQSRNS